MSINRQEHDDVALPSIRADPVLEDGHRLGHRDAGEASGAARSPSRLSLVTTE